VRCAFEYQVRAGGISLQRTRGAGARSARRWRRDARGGSRALLPGAAPQPG
jgi:hypothetical protein